MVVAETVDSIFGGKLRLRRACLGEPQIIKTQIGGQVGLVMAWEFRPCLGDIRPFRKAFSPPLVIFRDRMKLRKMERDRADRTFAYRWIIPSRPSTCNLCVQGSAILSTHVITEFIEDRGAVPRCLISRADM